MANHQAGSMVVVVMVSSLAMEMGMERGCSACGPLGNNPIVMNVSSSLSGSSSVVDNILLLYHDLSGSLPLADEGRNWVRWGRN